MAETILGKRCPVEDCPLLATRRGICKLHCERWDKARDYGAGTPARCYIFIQDSDTKKVIECLEPGFAANLCRKHYVDRYGLGQDKRPRKDPATKRTPGSREVRGECRIMLENGVKCTRIRYSIKGTEGYLGLCRRHYNEWENALVATLRAEREAKRSAELTPESIALVRRSLPPGPQLDRFEERLLELGIEAQS